MPTTSNSPAHSESPTTESPNDDKVYLPLPPPDNLYSEDPIQKLTETEQEKYDAVFSHFSKSEYRLPGFGDVENFKERLEELSKKEQLKGERRTWSGELIDKEKFWLSYECMLRYLRASKWKTQDAIQRLENTLKWRREYGIYDLITSDYISIEGETGKSIIFGNDIKGRPCYYMIPSRQNTEEGPRQIHHTVWTLERCIEMMPPGVETLAIMTDYASKSKNPSFSLSRTVLSILQDHYPERMGVALMINVPFILNMFFKMIMPFVDPVTREKVKFNPNVIQDNLVPKERLIKESWGGEQDVEYVHEKFHKALVEIGGGQDEEVDEKVEGVGWVCWD